MICDGTIFVNVDHRRRSSTKNSLSNVAPTVLSEGEEKTYLFLSKRVDDSVLIIYSKAAAL